MTPIALPAHLRHAYRKSRYMVAGFNLAVRGRSGMPAGLVRRAALVGLRRGQDVRLPPLV